MSPHFFFNMLNSIYHSIQLNPPKAEELLLHFSEMLRYQVYECPKKLVRLDHELEYLRKYLELEATRHATPPQFNIITEGDISDKKIIPLLITEIIRTILKEPFYRSEQPFLSILVKSEKTLVDIFIEASCTSETSGKNSHPDLRSVNKQIREHSPGIFRISRKKNPTNNSIELRLKFN